MITLSETIATLWNHWFWTEAPKWRATGILEGNGALSSKLIVISMSLCIDPIPD